MFVLPTCVEAPPCQRSGWATAFGNVTDPSGAEIPNAVVVFTQTQTKYVALSGLRTRVKSPHLIKGGTEVKFSQDDFQTKLIGSPERAPAPERMIMHVLHKSHKRKR